MKMGSKEAYEHSEDDEVSQASTGNEASSDEESESEEDVTAIFKGTDELDEESDEDDEDDESSDKREGPETGDISQNINTGAEQCIFDLRNMLAVNSDQIALSSLYDNNTSNSEENITIPLDKAHNLEVDEKFLLSKATKGCTQLIHALFQLPQEKSDAGPMALLPHYDEIRLPRKLPPPPPKQETKWEKFAKAKGIPLNKEKRSRKVWDETSGTWMYRHGYEKANSKDKEWPIMEVKANDDPYADPWEKIRDAKRARTDRNIESRMKNQERAGFLAKGVTNRVMKSRELSRKNAKKAGNMDRDNVPPTGVPVDLKGSQKRGKTSTNAALEVVQRSTASMGRFDKMREGEPERKKILSKTKKRKFESNTSRAFASSEGQKSMKILNAVMNGGGVEKEKAIRKGKYAKGETAYDYEYDDGLGASSFKKKKGRAGAGKNKKMTKRRIK